jgi:quercetin dioxygenase-like cupin family protein
MKFNRCFFALSMLVFMMTYAACGNGAAQRGEPSEGESELRQANQSSPGASIIPKSIGGVQATRQDLTFPIGEAINLPGSFSGNAYLSLMIAPDEVYHLPLFNAVTFEPGARSYWHSHDGMLVMVTGGVGYYQEEGKPAQIIRKGDVIEIAPGVKHWHGAAPDSWFSQMVVMVDSGYPGAPGIPQPVTDESYGGMETEEYVGRVITVDNEFMFQRADAPVTMPTFTGPVYLSSVVGGDNAIGAPDMHYVAFEPGIINNWHIHAGGQALIATDGIGYHQIEGQPVEVLYPGDVALCPPGVKHWHGGSADARFAHIAINTNPEAGGVEWLEPVSQDEYALLTTEKTDAQEGYGE